MTIVNVVRSWADEALLGIQRTSESQGAIRALADDADAASEITHAVGSGGTWDDPFDAVVDMARSGNSGVYDAWTAADAASTIFQRAAAKHAGGEGRVLLQRAAEHAEQAGGELGNWIATGGRTGTLTQVEAAVRPLLETARSAGERAVRVG